MTDETTPAAAASAPATDVALSDAPTDASTSSRSVPPTEMPGHTARVLLAVLSAGAGVLHIAAVSTHLEHHWTMGALFAITGWAQLIWAALLILRPTRRIVIGGAVAQAAVFTGYVIVHLVGWPLGANAGQPEPHGAMGLLACALELAVVIGVVLLTPWPGAVRVGSVPRIAVPLAGVLVVGLSSAAIAVGEPGHRGDHGDDAVLAAGSDSSDNHHGEAGTTTAASGATGGGGHDHGPVDTTPPTPEQRAAAEKLRVDTVAAAKKFPTVKAAKAAGYKLSHDAGGRLMHYTHPKFRDDGRLLDPKAIESLVYVTLPGGETMLVSAMYGAPKGSNPPQPGGSLTQWHGHDDLCIDPVKQMAITPGPTGCPPGSAVGSTGLMMHVWTIPYFPGPFAEIDPNAIRTGVIAVLNERTSAKLKNS